MGKLEISINLAESNRLINENKLKADRQFFTVIIFLIILLFILFVFWSNYNLQLEKAKRLELTNKNLNFDVEKKNRELVSKVNFISQRNEYLRSLKRKNIFKLIKRKFNFI